MPDDIDELTPAAGRIEPVDLQTEMQRSYLTTRCRSSCPGAA